MADSFDLRYRDTLSVLEVALLNPDGTAHDLTGSTDYSLHIRLSDGTRLVRTMVPEGALTLGVLRYTWVEGDWEEVDDDDLDDDGAYTAGGLVVGPGTSGPNGFILAPGEVEHRMLYEVIGPTGARKTFPSRGYHVLHIEDDIGQGE